MARPQKGMMIPAGIAIAALGLTACGAADAESNGDQENVELRFTWWGGESRHNYTQEIIDNFEEEYPHISVQPEYGEWGGYWDQLATQAAAGDLPDIIQMELRYMREYIDSDQFIPLDDVDVSDVAEGVLEGGIIDGELFGIPSGSTVPAIVANREVFDEAGVDFPDDTTWTWDDFHEITQQISDNSEAVGFARPFGDYGFEVWLRQHAGKDIVTDDGDVDLTAEDAQPYFELLLEMNESGQMAPASLASEDRSAAHEQTLVVTGQAAMYIEWDTVIMQLSGGENVNLEPLRFPTLTGDASDAELFYKPAMFYSVSAGSDHPEEAQLFIDYLINNEEAGSLTGIDRGLPANEQVREAILPELDEGASVIVDFQESIAEEVSPIPPVPPEGFGAVQDIIFRFEEEVIFGNLTPEQAAEQMVGEIESALS
ncbi:ABC transporter substrate-binding protein [Nesterenkonia alba]|uniref:ABC transporter substrate-binding protein n=1 Tax=Nesterenkonia alba TaxID=515814 RepID=UPI0003B418E5|nr:ABC transporter substrate-binding protein [Nesterenkonia alba]